MSSSMVTVGPLPPGSPVYSSVNTSHSSYTLPTPASQVPIIDTISVLSSSANSSTSTRDVVDLAKDSASISLNQILLNELQEGNLTDTLQNQPHLTQDGNMCMTDGVCKFWRYLSLKSAHLMPCGASLLNQLF